MTNLHHILHGGGIRAAFDAQSGLLLSLQLDDDALQTQFAGNPGNISYPQILERNEWIGDWLLKVWSKDHWAEERTALSADIRKVELDETEVRVSYEGASANPWGLRTLNLQQSFSVQNDAFRWEMRLTNTTDQPLEIGEVSLAFPTNTDFSRFFKDTERYGAENWRGEKQRLWHEELVQQHLSINRASSYAFLQRPRGDFPALLFMPVGDTALEVAYQMDARVGHHWSVIFEGPYYLSLFSKAPRHDLGWKWLSEQQRYWLNGNTSLLLEPGETKLFSFVFQKMSGYDDLPQALYAASRFDVEAWPGYIAPVGQETILRIRCREVPTLLPLAGGVSLVHLRTVGDCHYYRLVCTTTGHKQISVSHGGLTSHLFFFAVPDTEAALDSHAEFILSKQYYQNPADPFNRHQTFMPYDSNLDTIFLTSSESWQVGASDEYGLPVAMFLAEHNAISPCNEEIAALEEYVGQGILGKLQDPDTLLAIRGLYWEERYASDLYLGGKWDKELAASTSRSFNYPLLCDIYFSMYKIASRYSNTHVRSAEDYLELTYRTACRWFATGELKSNCAPAGGTIIEILQELERVNPAWFEDLNARVLEATRINSESVYPYGSELYIDQTPHNQLHAMYAYYGFADKKKEAEKITAALRAGMQPAWFLYGNEKRGNVCCWYATALNSRVLYQAFEETRDLRLLKWGYAGLMTILTTLRSSGQATGWFTWWPDRTGFDTRSLDTDMGLYGYLMTAKAYVVDDPELGLCGYGCRIDNETENLLTVTPFDGVQQRLAVFTHWLELDISMQTGRIIKVDVDIPAKQITIRMKHCSDDYPPLVSASTGWGIIFGVFVVNM